MPDIAATKHIDPNRLPRLTDTGPNQRKIERPQLTFRSMIQARAHQPRPGAAFWI
jgi:hypothetical protein